MPLIPYTSPYFQFAGIYVDYEAAWLNEQAKYGGGTTIVSTFTTANISSLTVSSINGAQPGGSASAISSFNTASISSATISSINGNSFDAALSTLNSISTISDGLGFAQGATIWTNTGDVQFRAGSNSGTLLSNPTGTVLTVNAVGANYPYMQLSGARGQILSLRGDSGRMSLTTDASIVSGQNADIAIGTNLTELVVSSKGNDTPQAIGMYITDSNVYFNSNVIAGVGTPSFSTLSVSTINGSSYDKNISTLNTVSSFVANYQTISSFNTASISSATISSINGEQPGAPTSWSTQPATSDITLGDGITPNAYKLINNYTGNYLQLENGAPGYLTLHCEGNGTDIKMNGTGIVLEGSGCSITLGNQYGNIEIVGNVGNYGGNGDVNLTNCGTIAFDTTGDPTPAGAITGLKTINTIPIGDFITTATPISTLSFFNPSDSISTLNIVNLDAMGGIELIHYYSTPTYVSSLSYIEVNNSINLTTNVGDLELYGASGQHIGLMTSVKDSVTSSDMILEIAAPGQMQFTNNNTAEIKFNTPDQGGIQINATQGTLGAVLPNIVMGTPITNFVIAGGNADPLYPNGLFFNSTNIYFNKADLQIPSQALQNTLNIVPFPVTTVSTLTWSAGAAANKYVPLAADTSITYLPPLSTINAGETGWRFNKTYSLIVPATSGLTSGSTYTIVTVGNINWVAIGASAATIGIQFTYNGVAITGTTVGTCTSSKKMSWYTLNNLYGLSLPQTSVPPTSFTKANLQNAWFLVKFNADIALQGNLAIQIDTYAYQGTNNTSNGYTGRWSYSFPLQQSIGFNAGATTNITTSTTTPRLRAGFTYLLYAEDNAPSVSPAASQYLPEGAGLFTPSQILVQKTLRNPYDIYPQYPHFGMADCLYSSNALQPSFGGANAYSDPGAVEVASIYLNTNSTGPFSGVGQTVFDWNVIAFGYNGYSGAGSNLPFSYSNVYSNAA